MGLKCCCFLFCFYELVRFSSVHGICALGKAHKYALHRVSQKFPQRCLWNGSNVHLIDDGPLSSFQGRSPNAYSFHASPSRRSMVSLALCPQVVSQAPQHFRSLEKQATCEEFHLSLRLSRKRLQQHYKCSLSDRLPRKTKHYKRSQLSKRDQSSRALWKGMENKITYSQQFISRFMA